MNHSIPKSDSSLAITFPLNVVFVDDNTVLCAMVSTVTRICALAKHNFGLYCVEVRSLDSYNCSALREVNPN